MNRWHYGQIQIGSMSDSSRLSFGHNVSYGHQSIDKSSVGFGSLQGSENEFVDNAEFIVDSDAIDSGQTNSLSFSNKASNLD